MIWRVEKGTPEVSTTMSIMVRKSSMYLLPVHSSHE